MAAGLVLISNGLLLLTLRRSKGPKLDKQSYYANEKHTLSVNLYDVTENEVT
jgi:hypothetical protein